MGEDRWLAAGETFRVRSDYVGGDVPFRVSFWSDDGDRAAGIDNVTVWVLAGSGDAEFTDEAGRIVACGHQRPEEIDRKWNEAARRPELGKPAVADFEKDAGGGPDPGAGRRG